MTEPEAAAGVKTEQALIYIPLHGVQLAEQPMECAGFMFVSLGLDALSNVEALWVKDQELDPMMRQRTFAVCAVDAADGLSEGIFEEPLRRYQELVVAARLAQSGVWIDAARVAPIARLGTQNRRHAGTARPRLWASVFGEPLRVRGRRRAFEGRIECRPLQYHLPHGPAFRLDADVAAGIEVNRVLLANLRQLAPEHGFWYANEAFQRGHDIFCARRVRLAALFSALEALFGGFRRDKKKKDPGLGASVATLRARLGMEPNGVEAFVEKELRTARNRVAHGADHQDAEGLVAVEDSLLSLVRFGLLGSALWITGRVGDPTDPAVGPTRSLNAFRAWLGRPPEDDD